MATGNEKEEPDPMGYTGIYRALWEGSREESDFLRFLGVDMLSFVDPYNYRYFVGHPRILWNVLDTEQETHHRSD